MPAPFWSPSTRSEYRSETGRRLRVPRGLNYWLVAMCRLRLGPLQHRQRDGFAGAETDRGQDHLVDHRDHVLAGDRFTENELAVRGQCRRDGREFHEIEVGRDL